MLGMAGMKLPPAGKLLLGAVIVAVGIVAGLPVVTVVGGGILVLGLFGIAGGSGPAGR
jgi:hypothetical protein